MVECFLAKEDVASSSLVSRSIKKTHQKMGLFCGLKLLARTSDVAIQSEPLSCGEMCEPVSGARSA